MDGKIVSVSVLNLIYSETNWLYHFISRGWDVRCESCPSLPSKVAAVRRGVGRDPEIRGVQLIAPIYDVGVVFLLSKIALSSQIRWKFCRETRADWDFFTHNAWYSGIMSIFVSWYHEFVSIGVHVSRWRCSNTALVRGLKVQLNSRIVAVCNYCSTLFWSYIQP